MDKQEVPFSVELIQKMLDCHRRIGALKVRFLMAVESPGVTDRQKLELKNGFAALAADLDRHFGEAKFRSVTPYNLHEVERLEGEYLFTIEKTVAELEKSARRLVHSPEGQSQVPAAAADIDRRLLAARIFEEPALEKDKLDHLNAVLGFLLARAGASPRAASPETIGKRSSNGSSKRSSCATTRRPWRAPRGPTWTSCTRSKAGSSGLCGTSSRST